MKTLLKPMLLTAAALVAVVLIVFGSLILWVESNRGRQWMQSRINAAIPGQLSIQRHRLSLLGPRLDLYDVVLRDPRGKALAGFRHLLVRLDGWALWQRKIRIDRVLLQAPWADLRPDKTAGTNLMAALLPATPKKKINGRAGRSRRPAARHRFQIHSTDQRPIDLYGRRRLPSPDRRWHRTYRRR